MGIDQALSPRIFMEYGYSDLMSFYTAIWDPCRRIVIWREDSFDSIKIGHHRFHFVISHMVRSSERKFETNAVWQ